MEWWRCRGEGSSQVKELLLESEQTGILDHFGHSYIYFLDIPDNHKPFWFKVLDILSSFIGPGYPLYPLQ